MRVHANEQVVVAARPLARAQAVTADDVSVLPRDLAALPSGYFRSPAEVLGQIAQRNIGAGAVRAPPLARRGQSVTLLIRAGALSVRAAGVAIADAALAERVQVRNSGTSRLVEGIVRSADTVEVVLD